MRMMLVGWPPDSRKQKVNNLTIFFCYQTRLYQNEAEPKG